MRLIDADAAIEKIRYMMFKDEYDVCEFLEECPTIKVPQWVSVKDRLPEKSGSYLVYFLGEMAITKFSAKHKKFNVYDEDTPKYATIYALTSVSHWMTLPKPPERKDD